jgi:cytochrome c oxidase subunit 2
MLSFLSRLLSLVWMPLLLAGCNLKGRQSFMDPKGEIAWRQYDLFMLTVWVTAGIFIVVGGVLAWTVWRYRERPEDAGKPLPKQSHGNPLIEIGLIGVSVALLVIIAVPTVREIWYQHTVPNDEPSRLGSWYGGDVAAGAEEEVLTIYAYGWQWWFSFEYPQLGITTGNEFAIPEDKTIRIELRSVDVIHSFWLPKIAGKVDMIPGRSNYMWIKGDEPGYYYGQCAEYCGESHAYMQFRAQVLPEEEFEDWVAAKRGEPAPPAEMESWTEIMTTKASELPQDDVVQGAKLFFGRGTCIQCHAIEGSPAAGNLGPDLTHVASRRSLAAGWMEHIAADGSIDRDAQYRNFVEWIGHSEDIKPGNLMYYGNHGMGNGLNQVELSEKDVEQLSAFMMTLK